VWASPLLAFLLGGLLVGLVVVAIVLPGLGRQTAAAPSASVSATASAVVASPSAATPSPEPTATPDPTPLPSVLEVQVQPGDSLTSIAGEYDTKARSIAFWNRDRYPNLDPDSPDYAPNRIQIGWTLVVYPGEVYEEPGASGSPAPSPGVASPTPSSSG
jgi:hypothetical protein